MQCENPQHCTNGYCVIITERISLKLDMEIDHIIYVSNDIFGFAVSPALTKILPIEVYNFFKYELKIIKQSTPNIWKNSNIHNFIIFIHTQLQLVSLKKIHSYTMLWINLNLHTLRS